MGDTHEQLVANVQAAIQLADTVDELLGLADWDDLTDEAREVLADHGIDTPEDDDTVEVADELLNTAALEVYGNARVTFDTVDVQSVTVVTGIGGPHVEFAVDYNGRVVAAGYWGSDTVERVTRVDRLGDYLAETLGGWDR